MQRRRLAQLLNNIFKPLKRRLILKRISAKYENRTEIQNNVKTGPIKT